MPIIIKEGEWLTHDGGKRYAVALRDIWSNDKVSSADFKMADGSAPIRQSEIPYDVIRAEGLIATDVCVEGEWRNLRTYKASEE